MLTGKQLSRLPPLGLALLLAAGCGGDTGTPAPPTYAVTGTVLGTDGKPLPGGIIQFICDDRPALNVSSMIAEDGTFALIAIHENENLTGALEGDCQVLVTLPIVGGTVPETIILPDKVHVDASENDITVDLSQAK